MFLFLMNFGEVVNSCCLIDLGFNGPPFTWTNNQRNHYTINKRLDRFMENLSWKVLYKEAHVTHHGFFVSDHRVITLDLCLKTNTIINESHLGRLFRFEPFWKSHANFRNVMQDIWSSTNILGLSSPEVLIQKLRTYGNQLNQWSLNYFGNIQRRLRDVQNHIASINYQSMEQGNRDLRRRLENQLDHLLVLNESYWKQRSQAEWLAGGDKNTKFFHHKASITRHEKKSMVFNMCFLMIGSLTQGRYNQS